MSIRNQHSVVIVVAVIVWLFLSGGTPKKRGLSGHSRRGVSRQFKKASTRPKKINWATKRIRESRNNKNLRHQFRRAKHQSKAKYAFNKPKNGITKQFNKRSAKSLRSTFNHTKAKYSNRLPKGEHANHVFSGKKRKFKDSPVSRAAITRLANGKPVRTDKYGTKWYSKKMSNGKWMYAYTRNGVIKGGGVNNLSYFFNKSTK